MTKVFPIRFASPWNEIDGYKFLTLGCILGFGAFIPSVMLGDSSKELLGFFDAYNTKTEGYLDNVRDVDG